MGAFSIKVKGAKFWNDLHNDLKTIPKIKKFRLKLKEFILPYKINQN